MASPPSSPVEKSAHIPMRRPEITILNEPKWRSTRRGFNATYSLPTRFPAGSHRARRMGSIGSAAQLTASKFTFVALHDKRDFRALEVAFLIPRRSVVRARYSIVSSMAHLTEVPIQARPSSHARPCRRRMPIRRCDNLVTIGPSPAVMRRRSVTEEIPASLANWDRVKTWSSAMPAEENKLCLTLTIRYPPIPALEDHE